MSYKAIIADIKKKNFSPVYFLHGSESYFIDEITKAVEKYALADHEKAVEAWHDKGAIGHRPSKPKRPKDILASPKGAGLPPGLGS